MRRMTALLVAAGLAAAPLSAAAGPCPDDHSRFESFEMSSGKGRLGVYVMSLTPELRKHFGAADDRGVMVARVEPASPAAAAGLQPGDVVTEVSGRAVTEATDVTAAIAGVPKEGKVALKVIRDHKPLDVSAKLTSAPLGFMEPLFTPTWFHELFRRMEHPRATTTAST